MSVDHVLDAAKTITTIRIKMPVSIRRNAPFTL